MNIETFKLYRYIIMIFFAFYGNYLFSQEKMINEENNFEIIPDTLSIQNSTDSLLILNNIISYDSLYYECDSTYYDNKKEYLYFIDKAKIKYDQSSITADTIFINLKNKQAATFGKSMMQDKSQLIVGKDIRFDFNSQNGMINNGISQFDKGFYFGKEIRKIDKKTFDIDDGYFTTCNAQKPHFQIYSKKMRLYQGDKVVAKPIIFEVNHFPLFAIPFGTFSIKRGRHTGFLVPQPGYSSAKGKKLENIAFYTYYGDNADFLLMYNYYEKTGWDANFRSKYIKRYIYNGNLNASLIKNTVYDGAARYNWRVNYRHSHTLANEASFDVNIDYTSSKQVYEEADDLNERLSESMDSGFNYKKKIFGKNLNITGRYSEDLKNNKKSITLPSISISQFNMPFYELFNLEGYQSNDDFWWKNLTFTYKPEMKHIGTITSDNADFWDVLFKTKKDSLGYINQHNLGVRQAIGISYSYKFHDWLNLSQSINGTEIWQDRDIEEDFFARAFSYRTTSSMSFDMYGIKTFENKKLKAIRHKMTPSISFSYHPDYSYNKGKYFSSPYSVDSGKKSRSVGFKLSNLWQIKYIDKTGKEVKNNSFVSLSSNTSMNLEAEGERFSDIRHSLSIKPTGIELGDVTIKYDVSTSFYQDVYDFEIYSWNPSQKLSFSGNISTYDYFPIEKNDIIKRDLFLPDSLLDNNDKDFTIDEIEKHQNKNTWSLSFGHSYGKNIRTHKVTANRLNTEFKIQFTQNWNLSYTNYYDFEESKITSQSLNLVRELHCWKLFFEWRKGSDGTWSYNLKFENIKLPDALKLETRDHGGY